MPKPHILLFEPRVEGHHLGWLHYITEDFLSADFTVTLAVDYGMEAKKRINDRLSDFIDDVMVMPVFDSGKWRGGSRMKTIAQCLAESGADEIFLPNLDEISSNCFRFAAIGMMPPQVLKGRLTGVYHRPRFLISPYNRQLGNRLKDAGFRRLANRHWFNKIFLVDEYLTEAVKNRHPDTGFHFVPDPAEEKDFALSKQEARNKLKIPPDKFVCLNYGVGDRRKGLHIAVRAMLGQSAESRLFLLCAGHIIKDKEVSGGLEQLERQGLAKVIDRYISDEEERFCFCAADAILLPYIRHIGSSGILSRAAAAGKMVIASDEFLIGSRVREHNLGLLFTSEDAGELRERMIKAATLSDSEAASYNASALRYARLCSREAFRKALLKPYQSTK